MATPHINTGDTERVSEGMGRVTNGFDQQLSYTFIDGDITEHVKFASQLEIEHGKEGQEKTKSARNLRISTIS